MILLSGAGGVVGRSLRERLVAAGHDVLALTHCNVFTSSAGEIGLDLEDAAQCGKLIEYAGNCSALIHLAGRINIELTSTSNMEQPPRASARRFADIYQSNVVMTARMLEVATEAAIPHVIFASSQTVYGLPATTTVVEESPLSPLEYYAASKVACETALALWARGQGRKATVLRFPGIWGESRQTGIVYGLCRQAIEKRRVTVGCEYPLPLDVLHHDDVTQAFEAALTRVEGGWRAYNIATGEVCSLARLANEVAALVPNCVVETFGVVQPDLALDASRAAKELGWRAESRSYRLARFIEHVRSEA